MRVRHILGVISAVKVSEKWIPVLHWNFLCLVMLVIQNIVGNLLARLINTEKPLEKEKVVIKSNG